MAAAAASTAGGVGSQLISGRFHSPLHTAGATRRGPDACGCSTLAAPLPRLCSVGYYVKKADCAPCSLPSCLDCAMCTPDTSGCIDGRQCTLCNTGHYRKLGKCEKASGNQLGRAAAAVHACRCVACLGAAWCRYACARIPSVSNCCSATWPAARIARHAPAAQIASAAGCASRGAEEDCKRGGGTPTCPHALSFFKFLLH